MAEPADDPPQFFRLGEGTRAQVQIRVDGVMIDALVGDSLLVAVLNTRGRLRVSEFGDGYRAGFCLMGACQDCWMWTEAGTRLRACTTTVQDGLSVLTFPREDLWPRIES